MNFLTKFKINLKLVQKNSPGKKVNTSGLLVSECGMVTAECERLNQLPRDNRSACILYLRAEANIIKDALRLKLRYVIMIMIIL